jgi:hypothetical protein
MSSLRVQHDVDEARQSRRHLVEATAAGSAGEQCLVPRSEIARHVLKVVEQLQEHAVTKGESFLRRACLAGHQIQVGQHRAPCETMSSSSCPTRIAFLLAQAGDLATMNGQHAFQTSCSDGAEVVRSTDQAEGSFPSFRDGRLASKPRLGAG